MSYPVVNSKRNTILASMPNFPILIVLLLSIRNCENFDANSLKFAELLNLLTNCILDDQVHWIFIENRSILGMMVESYNQEIHFKKDHFFISAEFFLWSFPSKIYRIDSRIDIIYWRLLKIRLDCLEHAYRPLHCLEYAERTLRLLRRRLNAAYIA